MTDKDRAKARCAVRGSVQQKQAGQCMQVTSAATRRNRDWVRTCAGCSTDLEFDRERVVLVSRAPVPKRDRGHVRLGWLDHLGQGRRLRVGTLHRGKASARKDKTLLSAHGIASPPSATSLPPAARPSACSYRLVDGSHERPGNLALGVSKTSQAVPAPKHHHRRRGRRAARVGGVVVRGAGSRRTGGGCATGGHGDHGLQETRGG